MNHERVWLVGILLIVLASGCATAGPSIQPLPVDPSLSAIATEWAELSRTVAALYEAGGPIGPDRRAELSDSIERFSGKVPEEELRAVREKLDATPVAEPPKTASPEPPPAPAAGSEAPSRPVRWDYRDGGWKPTGTPPACPEPLVLQAPLDLDIASSVLYPGQVRGGDFKPHGGFRTDGAEGPVEVRAPLEGYVKDVAYFTDQLGPHYMFDIQHECGIMYRLGHLGKVPPKFQAIAESVPMGGYGDSRTTEVAPVFVEAGEIIATDTQGSSGFDWGVYDLRKENEAAQDPTFREAHADEPWQAYHAVCWLDWLAPAEAARAKALPGADGVAGKESDYC